MTVLALDVAGNPRKWISAEDAVTYHAKNQVAWSLGDVIVNYHGGTQRSGIRSEIQTTSIIAIKDQSNHVRKYKPVVLTNKTLFGRDRHLCAYCGTRHTPNKLSRDHIVPSSRGGGDTWMNTVTACIPCNLRKGSKLLSELKWELLYVPYVPNNYEKMILENRHILADQMDYLMAGVPAHSRLL